MKDGLGFYLSFLIFCIFSVYVIQGVSSGSPSSDSQHLLLCLGLASANEAGFSLWSHKARGGWESSTEEGKGWVLCDSKWGILVSLDWRLPRSHFYSGGKTASLRVIWREIKSHRSLKVYSFFSSYDDPKFTFHSSSVSSASWRFLVLLMLP